MYADRYYVPYIYQEKVNNFFRVMYPEMCLELNMDPHEKLDLIKIKEYIEERLVIEEGKNMLVEEMLSEYTMWHEDKYGVTISFTRTDWASKLDKLGIDMELIQESYDIYHCVTNYAHRIFY